MTDPQRQRPDAPAEPRSGSRIAVSILIWYNLLHWPALLLFDVYLRRRYDLDPFGREAWTLVGSYAASTAVLYAVFLARAIAGRMWRHHPKAFRWFLVFPPFVFFYFWAARKDAWRYDLHPTVRRHVALQDEGDAERKTGDDNKT